MTGSQPGKVPQVLVTDGAEYSLPYSKGLTSSRLMVTGLSLFRSYQVAERIEERLIERGDPTIGSDELSDLAIEVIREFAGERYAKNFIRWRDVEKLDVPIVILIGGATGVGKSTIATQLAARLGIVRVVATDAIREVMRGVFSRELMPTLYTSSFNADTALREAPLRAGERIIVGFREQTAAVAVGIRALLERAAVEGTSVIIEGAHAVPGFVDFELWQDRVLLIPVVLTVEDDDIHRTHFVARGVESAARPADRYLDDFDKIRKVQKYIKSQALHHGVPVIPNYNLDQSLTAIIDLIVERSANRAGSVEDIDGAPVTSDVATSATDATMEDITA